MRCPFCGSEETQVKDSRPTEDNTAIRRRRFCPACNARFTTFERVQLRELTVVKKHGKREAFDRDKLFRSIEKAVRKRPVEPERVERLVSSIVRRLESMGETDIDSKEIGALARPETLQSEVLVEQPFQIRLGLGDCHPPGPRSPGSGVHYRETSRRLRREDSLTPCSDGDPSDGSVRGEDRGANVRGVARTAARRRRAPQPGRAARRFRRRPRSRATPGPAVRRASRSRGTSEPWGSTRRPSARTRP